MGVNPTRVGLCAAGAAGDSRGRRRARTAVEVDTAVHLARKFDERRITISDPLESGPCRQWQPPEQRAVGDELQPLIGGQEPRAVAEVAVKERPPQLQAPSGSLKDARDARRAQVYEWRRTVECLLEPLNEVGGLMPGNHVAMYECKPLRRVVVILCAKAEQRLAVSGAIRALAAPLG